MAVPNEVRVNIRHHILLLKTFTVPQLQAVTGLNRQSIHTEIRRMEKDGLVSRFGTEEGKKEPTGGRPSVIYQLTPDPEKRLQVLQSVRAFYIATEERPSELPRPESKHYFIAKELLEGVTAKGTILTQEEKSVRLDEIEKRLEYARQEEEVGEEGTQLIAASFDILEAEALDVLDDDWKSAVKLLDEARKTCRRLEARDLMAEVDAHVQTMVDRMAEEQRQLIANGRYEEAGQVLSNLHIIEFCFDDLPGIHRSIEYAKMVDAMARADQRATQLVANAQNEKMRDLIRETPLVIERPVYVMGPRVEAWWLTSETRATFAPTLLQKQAQDNIERFTRPDLAQALFGSVQAPESERLKE